MRKRIKNGLMFGIFSVSLFSTSVMAQEQQLDATSQVTEAHINPLVYERSTYQSILEGRTLIAMDVALTLKLFPYVPAEEDEWLDTPLTKENVDCVQSLSTYYYNDLDDLSTLVALDKLESLDMTSVSPLQYLTNLEHLSVKSGAYEDWETLKDLPIIQNLQGDACLAPYLIFPDIYALEPLPFVFSSPTGKTSVYIRGVGVSRLEGTYTDGNIVWSILGDAKGSFGYSNDWFRMIFTQTVLPDREKGKVTVIEETTEGLPLQEPKSIEGYIGDPFELTAESREGYTLVSGGSYTGFFIETPQEFRFVYQKDALPVEKVTLIIQSKTKDGKLLKTMHLIGEKGKDYVIEPEKFDGYSFDKEASSLLQGVFAEDQTLILFYDEETTSSTSSESFREDSNRSSEEVTSTDVDDGHFLLGGTNNDSGDSMNTSYSEGDFPRTGAERAPFVFMFGVSVLSFVTGIWFILRKKKGGLR